MYSAAEEREVDGGQRLSVIGTSVEIEGGQSRRASCPFGRQQRCLHVNRIDRGGSVVPLGWCEEGVSAVQHAQDTDARAPRRGRVRVSTV